MLVLDGACFWPARRSLEMWTDMQRLIVLPAVLATLGALVLGVVFGIIPALSNTDYLNVNGVAPGASDGDLVILGDVSRGSLAVGETVAPAIPGQGRQLYSVLGIEGQMVLLGATTGPVVVAPEAVVTHRLSSTVGGLGDLFGFVDTAHGWATIAASTLGLWLIAGLVLRRSGRSSPAAAPMFMAAVVGSEQGVPVQVVAERLPMPEAVASIEVDPIARPPEVAASVEPVVAERGSDDAAAAAPKPTAIFDDPLLTLVREVAQQAPQAGLRHARRIVEIGPSRKAAGWAGLAATATVVAAATYLVASERGQKKAARRFRLR